MRRGWIRAAAASTAAVAACVVPAGAAAAPPAAGTDCQEQQAFVDGDPAVVAERLPDGYTAMTNPASGRPLVFARGLRCADLTIDGRGGPAVMASYGVLIESPDGRGCGSASPAGSAKGDEPPVCNWYVLQWLTSDRRVVDWLRAGTPDVPAVHVPELAFDLGTFDAAQNGAPFSFRAGGSSPYTIDGTAREGQRELAVRGGYWVEADAGTIKIALSSDDLRAGDSSGTVTAPAGSPVARLMGAEQRELAPVFAAFSTVRAGHGVYRKQILPPPHSTAGLTGTCSFKGLVTFKPKANNTTQQLAYDYTAEGTCNGSLDGRDLKDTPVRLYQAGRSEGGCRAAKTVAPGVGTMTLEGGKQIRYTLDFTTQSTQVEASIYGERSGLATGRGTFLTDRTPPDVTVRCAGEGTETIPLDITFTTQSALVNEPPAERPRLRLGVTPRSVKSGRRTTYRFRVSGPGGAPLRGASVRFYGKRVQTGADGIARVTATLRKPGGHPARAKAVGHRGAQATITVRRR
jgi:hypothetical protein